MPQVPINLPPRLNVKEQGIMLVQALPKGKHHEKWNRFGAKAMGITLILIAITTVACNIAWFSFNDSFVQVGVGVWAGGMVLVTGVLLTVSGFRPSRCIILSVLVMCAITILFVIACIIVCSIRISVYSPYEYNRSRYDELRYTTQIPYQNSTLLVTEILYIFIAFFCFGLLLMVSIWSSHALYTFCSCCVRHNTRPIVTFIANGKYKPSQPFMDAAPIKDKQKRPQPEQSETGRTYL